MRIIDQASKTGCQLVVTLRFGLALSSDRRTRARLWHEQNTVVIIMRVAPCALPRQMFRRPADGGARGDVIGNEVRSDDDGRGAPVHLERGACTSGVIG